MTSRRWSRIGGLVLVFVIFTCVTAVFWFSTGLGPGEAAAAAMQSNASVQVVAADELLTFVPMLEESRAAFIFYPGARVDFRAYAPPLEAIAGRGYTVYVVRMPLNLALLNTDAAGGIIAQHPEVSRWVVGGHSLGGVAAANFAVVNPGVDWVVFWASYPQDDALKNLGIPVLAISASLDGLTSPESVAASKQNLPADTVNVEIVGGNHSQFGDYGFQAGDNTAVITASEQWAQIVQATTAFLEKLTQE